MMMIILIILKLNTKNCNSSKSYSNHKKINNDTLMKNDNINNMV